ncbi:MAG: modification methylase M [Mucilaginibacter sp.]|nr:modification methylase M [Mucilaginibacter sp.]
MALIDSQLTIDDSIIFIGDCVNVLKRLRSNSVQCIITSPPYWGMRDYNIQGQIGLENEINEYFLKLELVFNEAKRILKKNGTLWLNIGDGYTSGNRKYRASDKKNPARKMTTRPDTPSGLKRKDLIGIPWKLAFRLQESGWYLRSDIIWHKPNGMPESVKDRPYRNHEYLFLLSKSERYQFDAEALKAENGKRQRSVWEVPTKANNIKHSAIFPEDLIIGCVECSTKKDEFVLDPFFGSGTVGKICKELDRKFIGIEINSEYVSMALERINSEINVITSGTIKEISSSLDSSQMAN